MSNIKNSITQETMNIIALGLLSLALSLDLLIVVVFIFSFIPLHLNEFALQLFPLYQRGVLPEREMAFYRFFVFANIGLMAGLIYFFRKRLGDQTLSKDVFYFLGFEAAWILLQLFAVFKIILYGNPAWARYLFYAALAFSTVFKVFWPEVRVWLGRVKEGYRGWINIKGLDLGLVIAVCVFIAGVIYAADVKRVLAMITVWGSLDQFHQWREISVLKDLNDERFLRWMMTGMIVYFCLMFVFLRSWLNSTLLAAGAVFLAVKWQLFHLGAMPVVWQYPQKIDPTQFIDLALFALLLVFVRFNRKPLLCVAVLGLMIEGGRYLWSALSGPDMIPVYFPLRGRNFFAFSWQFVVPIIYVMTLLVQVQKQRRDSIMVVAACIFGMLIFTQHIKDSTITNHYTHSLPLVMVFVFWMKELCDKLSTGRAVLLKSVWALVMLIALLTSNLCMIYPNVFSVSGINWEQVKTAAKL